MVIAVLGVEPIKDPSVDDWEGGCVFWKEMEPCLLPRVGCVLTWVWGAASAKWQGLISFAKTLPLNVDVQL